MRATKVFNGLISISSDAKAVANDKEMYKQIVLFYLYKLPGNSVFIIIVVVSTIIESPNPSKLAFALLYI